MGAPATQSQRMRGQLLRFIPGALLFLGGLSLLSWNEGQAVRRDRARHQLRRGVVEADADAVNPANEGEWVLIQGILTSPTALRDPIFGLPTTALRLRRRVELRQWAGPEHSDQEIWADRLLPDVEIQGELRRNPDRFPFDSQQENAGILNLGSFQPDPRFVQVLNHWEPLTPRQPELPPGVRHAGTYLFAGQDPAAPQVGDARIFFELLPEQTVTVVARQQGNRLLAGIGETGQPLFLLRPGEQSLRNMIPPVPLEVEPLHWTARLLAVLLLYGSLQLLLPPLVTAVRQSLRLTRPLPSPAPAVILMLALSLCVTIGGIAWVSVRPLLGGVLIADGLLGFWIALRPQNRAFPQPET